MSQIGICGGLQMNFIESGAQHDKVILLLHGGGLAPWNYVEEAALLQEKYHILLPVLNGHNSSGCAFTTIEDAACRIIAFIDEHFDGKVFLIGGLSLGGQILIEMLSQRKNICQYAIIESALVLPMRATARLIKPTYELCYSLIKKRWFARLQFASLHIQPALFEAYFRDSSAISKSNMTAFLMANADYKAKPSLADCNAKLLVLVGEKERKIVKRSAKMICQAVQGSSLEILPGFYHGDLSINHPALYVEKVCNLIGEG